MVLKHEFHEYALLNLLGANSSNEYIGHIFFDKEPKFIL